jgi:long-chain acyl-CoA synthetase
VDSEVLALLRRIGYPEAWLAEAAAYTPRDAYTVFDPRWADEVPEIPETTVDVIVQRQAQQRPDAAAIVYLDRTITYRELHDLVGRAAAVLRDSGVGRGDVVAVMVPTSAIHWVVFFAVARIGATHCGVNVMYQREELEYVLADAQPTVLVCLDQLLPVVEQIPPDARPNKILTVTLRDLADQDFHPYPALLDWWHAPAVHGEGTYALIEAMDRAAPLTDTVEVDARNETGQIIYTAGTTGHPKGVLQTHFNLVHNSMTHTLAMPGIEVPVTYSVLPLFHTGGFFVYSMPTFARGGTVVPRPLFDPGDALSCVQKYSVNAFFGPPTLFLALLAYGLDNFDLSSIEFFATGAAPVPDDLPERWQAATGVELGLGWGMSELNGLGTFNGLPGRRCPGTLGVPVIGEVRVTLDGAVVAKNIDGEIEYRGMQVSKGYLGNPAETEATFTASGWLRSGDIGRIDDTGALNYVDRRKDLIFASGYNISPAEIENTLLAHPGITDAAVIGEPHPYRGEVPVAFVVGTVLPDEVVSYCRERLAAIKVPARVVVLEQLPKNTMGKTLKRTLRTTGSDG